MSTGVCSCVFHGCSLCLCALERALGAHTDVKRSCGLCWTLIRRGFFFSSCFMFRRSAMESMSTVTFTPVIFSVHLFHTPPSSLPSPSLHEVPFTLTSSSPLCVVVCCSCPFLSFCFFPLPAPLALPPGRGGTVMFMKPFNVLCNYPGNTSHHYSCQ